MSAWGWRVAAPRLLGVVCLVSVLGGCSAEVGSDAWCRDMDGKPKGDWSVNDAADYTKHCVLGLKPEKQ